MLTEDKVYNEIYDDRIVKYCLNIPKGLYSKLCRKTDRSTKYGGRKSVYVRELLEQALTDERLPKKREYKKLLVGEVYEPPKRFSGFVDGLLRNSYRWTWFKKKYLDKRLVQW